MGDGTRCTLSATPSGAHGLLSVFRILQHLNLWERPQRSPPPRLFPHQLEAFLTTLSPQQAQPASPVPAQTQQNPPLPYFLILDQPGKKATSYLKQHSIWGKFSWMVATVYELPFGRGGDSFGHLTNTPHFSNPSGSVNSSNFFSITSTSDNAPERYIRFGFKLTF